MKSNQAKSSLSILVDTQADITIVKISCLLDLNKLDKSEIITMKGITNEKQFSLGSMMMNFCFSEFSIEHKVHVVADDFQMPAHGILGKDFLHLYKCLVDYSNMTFMIRPNNETPAVIELHSEVIRGISAVPARSEAFKLFRINSKIFPCVIPAQEFDKNVFVPTTIVSQKESYIRVLNTSYDMKLIDTSNPKLVTENIDDYEIISERKSKSFKNQNERTDRLMDILSIIKSNL